MKSYLTIGSILILMVLFSCQTKNPFDKMQIDINSVDSIIVIERQRGATINLDVPNKAIKLTHSQTKTIVDNWNNAPSVGLWKYSPTFEMSIYLDNQTVRHFRINSEHIKENFDESYDLGDKRFFEKLLTIE